MYVNQQTLAKEPTSSALIRFQDCDPFGHLNNARYIDYFMNARMDHLLEFYNFDIFATGREMNKNWVVTKNQIAYVTPAMLMEKVVIKTRLIHYEDSRLIVEGVMLDQAEKRLKAVTWIEFTFVSMATGRTARHPETLTDFFHQVLAGEGFAEDHFNDRVRDLKECYKKQRRELPV